VTDEAGIAEHPQVPAHRRPPDRKREGELADGSWTLRQLFDDPSTHGIA
jgi:hypothetical protein